MCLAFRLEVVRSLVGELLQLALLIGHRPQKKQKREKICKKEVLRSLGTTGFRDLKIENTPLCPLCVPSFTWPVSLSALHMTEERRYGASS